MTVHHWREREEERRLGPGSERGVMFVSHMRAEDTLAMISANFALESGIEGSVAESRHRKMSWSGCEC